MTRRRFHPPGKLLAGVFGTLLLMGVALVIAQDQETLRIKTTVAAEDPRFPMYLALLLGHPLTEGDAYEVHTNGDAAFPSMIDAIDKARARISLETYIFANDDTGRRFHDALLRAARRRVLVRVVLDAVGAATMDSAMIEALESAGAQIGWYNKVASKALEEANYRTHRKALVVDGLIAFIGGMGFADHWAREVDGLQPWRDSQIELRGPVVDHIEGAFNENWIETVGVADPQVQAVPAATPGGGQSVVVRGSSQGGINSLKVLYLLAIAAARRTIDIQSPYVITDESAQWSLADARQRGVRVRILMEGDITDAKPVKFAGRADYDRLLRLGIEIYEYQPAMMHAKAMVIDGVLSIVGSANFDNRSLELNDELNVAAFDTALATRLTRDFENDLRQSARIDLNQWRARPVHIRARDKVWSLFGEVF